MRRFAAAAVLSMVSMVAYAHDGHLVGEGLSLDWTDHALVGKVDSYPVFGDSLSDEFGLRFFMRVEGQTFTTTLKKQDGEIRSELVTTRGGENSTTTFVVTSIDAGNGIIRGKLDADEFEVKISAAEMNGAHYVNPKFDVKIGDAHYAFHMDDGQACIGCSVKIVFAVLAAKRNNGTLWISKS